MHYNYYENHRMKQKNPVKHKLIYVNYIRTLVVN